MRRLLLWAAQNRWLAAHVPRWWFARRAVRRFLPGESFEAALKAAVDFKSRNIGALFTVLGENVTDLEDANRVVQHYEEVLAATGGVQAEISVKPTQLGLDIDAEAAYANLMRLARAARNAKSFMWIDMEGSDYTESTLQLYRFLRATHANVGICLQAYLRRTRADLESLLPMGPAIRIVKGAYAEPDDKAFPDKREVDDNFHWIAEQLWKPEARANGAWATLGTHDRTLISELELLAKRMGVGAKDYEYALLYGIQRGEQLRLVKAGRNVRVLISYGAHWFPWYMRRLAERPANLLFVAKSMFAS